MSKDEKDFEQELEHILGSNEDIEEDEDFEDEDEDEEEED